LFVSHLTNRIGAGCGWWIRRGPAAPDFPFWRGDRHEPQRPVRALRLRAGTAAGHRARGGRGLRRRSRPARPSPAKEAAAAFQAGFADLLRGSAAAIAQHEQLRV